jgi:cobalt-zinc-cadmium efflux system outer membrane protein
MITRMVFVGTLVVGCLAAPAVEAQGGTSPLSLADARSRALAASPELRAAEQALAAAAGRARQAGAWTNPTLTYGREQTSRDGETNSQDIVSLDQRVEIFGQRGARRRVAELEQRAAGARLSAARSAVSFEVTRVYAAAVAATQRAALANEAAGAFGTARRVSRARLAGGDVSGYQHRRLLLEAARYATLRSSALLARDSALRSLSLLIGGSARSDSTARLGLTDTLAPAPLALTVDSLVTLGTRARGELVAGQLEAQAASAGIRAASSERIPAFTLSGGYKDERLATGESLRGFVAGVSLPLPLWDRRGGAIAAARGEAGRRTAELERLRRQTVLEIEDAYATHQALGGQLVELRSQLGEEARKARRSAEAAYTEGEISLLEWLDSVRAYQEAEAAYATLWSEYVTRRAALERLTGLTLF